MPCGWTASPPLGNAAKAAVSSRGVTLPVPRASEATLGWSRRPRLPATRSTLPVPTFCWSATAAWLFDWYSASRSVWKSGDSPPALRGAHSSRPGAVTSCRLKSTVTGEKPCCSAAAYTNGLKAEPGWRWLFTARLKGEALKSRPPTRARMAPVPGSRTTRAPCSSGMPIWRRPS